MTGARGVCDDVNDRVKQWQEEAPLPATLVIVLGWGREDKILWDPGSKLKTPENRELLKDTAIPNSQLQD